MDEIKWDIDLSDLYDRSKSQSGIQKVFVLDGQQRLQTLYSIFAGSVTLSDNRRGEAFFDATSGIVPDEQGLLHRLKFTADNPGLPWYRVADMLAKDAQKNAEELADRINDELDTIENSSPEDHRESPEDAKARQKRVRKNMGQLVSLLREDKHFWIQELDGVANDFPYGLVLDIFVRVNSGGTKLDSSDLMFAAMKEGWDEIEEVIEETTALLNGTNLQFDKTFTLKCLLVAHGRGAEASPEKFAGAEGEKLLKEIRDGWNEAEMAFQQLRDFMQQEVKVYADKVIRSYNSFIPLLDFLFHNPKPDITNRHLMRAYHYKAQLFGWYSQSTDTVVNALHAIVGKPNLGAFPMDEIKKYFVNRSNRADLTSMNLNEARIRLILLNLIYVNEFGSSPFDVKFKGNQPHVDHIYPQSSLRSKLNLDSTDVNHLGNFRFVGATDNIRKRAELPADYFARLQQSGVDIRKHLLLEDESADPKRLQFDAATYKSFRDRRYKRISEIISTIVDPEI